MNVSQHSEPYDNERFARGRIHGIRVPFIVAILLVSITIPLFSQMFNHSFVNYDDYNVLVNRIDVYDGFSVKNLKRIVLEDYPREEPLILRDITYLINANIFGPLNPRGYLLGNLFLHVSVCYLVYLLCLQIFPRQYFLAIFSAILFSINPMHVESIAWISSRKDPLYVFFLLTALLMYFRYFEKNHVANLFFSFLFFFCALFSKSAAISFFPLVLSYRITLKKYEKIKKEEIAFYLAVIVCTILFVIWYTKILTEFGVLRRGLTTDRDWGLWLISCFTYITFYLQKLLVPINLSIMYDYPAPHILFSDAKYAFISTGIVGLSLAFLLILWRRGKNQIVFLGLLFLGALLPYLDLAQVDIFVANRYAYLASVAFCIVFAYGILGIDSWLQKRQFHVRYLLLIGCFTYCLFLGFQTFQAIKPWENTIKLWQNANKVAHRRAEVYVQLMKEYMYYYLEHQKEEEGKIVLKKSMDLGENAIKKFCNNSLENCPIQLYRVEYSLAQIYWLQGKIQKTEEFINAALKLNPNYYQTHYLYAKFLITQKRYDDAMEHIKIIEKVSNPYLDKVILDDIKNILIPTIKEAQK